MLSLGSILLSGTLQAAITPNQFVNRPLVFEPNQDQGGVPNSWLARGPGYQVFVAEDSAMIAVHNDRSGPPSTSIKDLKAKETVPALSKPHTRIIRMKLQGGHPWNSIHGLEATGGFSHYYYGNDPTKWRTNVPHYSRLKVEEVYDGIDLTFHAHNGDLEYDFVLAPGANPEQIRCSFPGTDGMRIDAENGDLLLAIAPGQEMRILKPKVCQRAGAKIVEVAGNYEINQPGELAFKLAPYDSSRALVIDPTIKVTTFLQGNGDDTPAGIAVDSAGNSYVTGYTFSTDFPIVGGLEAPVAKTCTPSENTIVCPPYAFVTKLSPTGAILFSTYLGGNSIDIGRGIAVDATGSGFDGVYVTGITFSGETFPQTTTQYAVGSGDAFVTKLFLTGTLYYSTLFGGSDIDDGYAIAVDSSHAAYVAGLTQSVDFPTSAYFSSPLRGMQEAFGGGQQDAFVTKIDAFGFLNEGYSTYLGGADVDRGQGITVDSNGYAYVTGVTASQNFPTVGAPTSLPGPGMVTAFVTKLLPNGSGAVYSIYLGGGGADEGLAIAVDNSGTAFVGGDTLSASFQTTAGVLQPHKPSAANTLFSGFVSEVSPLGFLRFSTYLGGSDDASCTSIGLNRIGEVYVGGWTRSTVNFPGAPMLTPNPTAGFLTKLNGALSAAGFTTLLGAQINGLALPKPVMTRRPIFMPPIGLVTTEIYTTGFRWRAGSDPKAADYDGFVVHVEDSPLSQVLE
jgi:hypothetical protein